MEIYISEQKVLGFMVVNEKTLCAFVDMHSCLCDGSQIFNPIVFTSVNSECSKYFFIMLVSI